MSLLELLKDAYGAQKNFQDKKFISLKTARGIVTKDRITEWSKNHPLCLEHGHECPQKTELIHKITKSNVSVFIVLVFAELEFLIKRLIASYSSDLMLFDTKTFERVCDSAELSAEQKQGLVKCRSYVGVIFPRDRTQDVPGDAILPFLKRESLERYGSYGVLYRLTVPGQHLPGYNDTVVIAEKRIRPMSDPSQDDWERLSREVQTLQKRGNHPNIIPLLASYTLDTVESGHHVKVLYLLFPLAEMDLADWITKPQTPFNVARLSKLERQVYIYRSIYEVVSGISYLHREVDGEVTAHHDLKPRNILLVDDKMKIGDFGHSHLRPILEGSATDRASGLGTYEYQPPEYYNEDGSRAQVKHGRAFDVWATGCILIELATLVVDDWQSEMITKFRDERKRNLNRDRKIPASVQDGSDVSFHNNMIVVKDWVGRLRKSDGSQQLNEVLSIAGEMVAPKPENRPYMWEVQTDLYETLTPYDNYIPELEADLCVAPEFEDGRILLYHRYPVSHYPAPYIEDGTETPLHRAARKDNRRRTIRLWELGWPSSLPDGNGDTPRDIMRRSDDIGLRTLEDDIIKMLNAAKTGNIGEIRTLFSRGLTPLMVDANGYSALYEAITSFQIEVIDFLLESKTKEQLMLWNPATENLPLHTAARVGSVEALDRVLKHYPDCINITAPGQRTALYYGTYFCHADVIKFLLKNKAQMLLPELRDYAYQYTPLHAATRGDIMELLLEADDGHECMEHKYGSMSPLFWAANCDHASCFEVLLQHGASVHVVNSDGLNLSWWLTRTGKHDLLRLCIEKFSLEELEYCYMNESSQEEAEDRKVAQLLKSQIRQRRSGGSSSRDSGFIPNWIKKLDIRQRKSGGSSS